MMASDWRLMRPFGLRREADVEGEEVGVGEDVLYRDEGDIVLARDHGGDEGIVADELHAEGAGAAGDLEADAAEADDAEGLATELGALERLLVPLARVQAGVGVGDLAGHGDHEAEGELGDSDGVGAGGVHDDNARRRVAASMSMLSTPTPARPMTRSEGACSNRAAST